MTKGLARALYAESLKLKRTIALKMVVIAPAAVVLLVLVLTSQAPFTMLRMHEVQNEWITLARLDLMYWAVLMMPLYIALQSALISGLDHADNQWKSLLARPVPRWTLYVAKLIVVAAMTIASALLLLGGVLASGAVLPFLQSDARFAAPVPFSAIFRDGAGITGLAFLALMIQHWISLRWRAFSIAIGTGIVATVVGYFADIASRHTGGLPQYFPWSLPMMVLAKYPHNTEATLAIAGILGLTVAAAGCFEFCRREVT